jgi:hypothetical protein
MKYPFTLKQTGPIELTENLGTDPAYYIPVEIVCKNKKLQESVKKCTRIYYHASVGWVPATNDNELSTTELLPAYRRVPQYDEFESKLIKAIDELGATALARVFRLADALYNKGHADVAIALVENDVSLKPIKVTDKSIRS